MADSRTAETLRKKRGEIARSIDDYEARLAQAKADLAHIDAAIAIFATGDGQKPVRPYVDIHRLFKRGELAAISREALKDARAIPANWRKQPFDARRLSAYCLRTGQRAANISTNPPLYRATSMSAEMGWSSPAILSRAPKA